jgi:putative transposase
MRAICDEFESYGYRRVGAALRHQGIVVNGKTDLGQFGLQKC